MSTPQLIILAVIVVSYLVIMSELEYRLNRTRAIALDVALIIAITVVCVWKPAAPDEASLNSEGKIQAIEK